ncbi:MAG: acyl-CoA dehydrogenase, partial [Alphaproteobacteria bacterium]
MDFAYSERCLHYLERVRAFMEEHIYPNEEAIRAEIAEGDRWQPSRIIEELKAKAKAEGLWNLFLPDPELGAGLSNVDYAPIAEEMGRSPFA